MAQQKAQEAHESPMLQQKAQIPAASLSTLSWGTTRMCTESKGSVAHETPWHSKS